MDSGEHKSSTNTFAKGPGSFPDYQSPSISCYYEPNSYPSILLELVWLMRVTGISREKEKDTAPASKHGSGMSFISYSHNTYFTIVCIYCQDGSTQQF